MTVYFFLTRLLGATGGAGKHFSVSTDLATTGDGRLEVRSA